MKRTPETLQILAVVFVFLTAVLIFFNVGQLRLLIPLNLFAFSTVFLALAYGAVIDQSNPQAKRLLIVGIGFLVVALIVFIFGQIF